VGYSHVIEDLGEQGESWHSFETFPDFTGSGFPFAPVEALTGEEDSNHGSEILPKETTS
jgi:hypothetical protein